MVEMQKLSREDFASAAWTTVSEPGDELAGLLRLTLGAAKALELLIERAPAVRISKLLQDSEHAEIAAARFGKLTETIADGLERWLPRLSKTEVENALKVAAACRANFVSPEHEEWPSGLSDLGLAMPAGLWVRGSLERIAPALAIVGSRTATSYGAWVCAEFVSALADRSVAVVSGGAFGIDAAAHRAGPSAARRLRCLPGQQPAEAVLVEYLVNEHDTSRAADFDIPDAAAHELERLVVDVRVEASFAVDVCGREDGEPPGAEIRRRSVERVEIVTGDPAHRAC